MLNKINLTTSDLLLKQEYRISRHILIFVTIILITINILWDEPTHIISDRYGAWLAYFFMFLGVIYINMYLLVPKMLMQGKTKRYIIFTILLMCLFILSVGTLQSIAGDDDIPQRTPVWIGIASGIASFLLLIIGLTALQLFKFRLMNQQKISELENITMAVKLANLQNQINPHFLFNMLNNANVMVTQDVQKSYYILSRLKDLLSYQINKSAQNLVDLDEEISFLKDFLELEKLRRDRFTYTLSTKGDTSINIPPVLFIPFIENAVKHNPENGASVVISFVLENNKLYFECKNNKARSPIIKKEGGIGLSNVKRRLALLFEANHKLHLEDEKEYYTVILEIEL